MTQRRARSPGMPRPSRPSVAARLLPLFAAAPLAGCSWDAWSWGAEGSSDVDAAYDDAFYRKKTRFLTDQMYIRNQCLLKCAEQARRGAFTPTGEAICRSVCLENYTKALEEYLAK